MGTPAKDRIKAYRAHQRQEGFTRLTVSLCPEAHAALRTLKAEHPTLSVDALLNGVLTGRILLRGNSPSRYVVTDAPLRGNSTGCYVVTDQLLHGNGQEAENPPLDDQPPRRANLAEIGHRWRKEGLSTGAIAERFNRRGWTPDRVPKQPGVKPRSDSPRLWTEKAVSQLLTRDYPRAALSGI